VLDTIITLSPLLGLLGTVTGMIAAFGILSSAGMNQPTAITGGVAEALIATAAGLGIAIVTLVPYNYFTARAEQAMDAMERLATRLEAALREQQIP
jgi:biopolymer transport protein ExbB